MNKLLFLLTAILTIISSCFNEKDYQTFISQEQAAKEQAQTIEMIYSDSGIVRIRLLAPSMTLVNDRNYPVRNFPHGIKVDFFNPKGKIESKLVADQAVQYLNDQKVELKGNVHFSSDNGRSMQTEALTWDDKNEKIFSTKYVQFKGPDGSLNGYGFESNPAFTLWKVFRATGNKNISQLE